MSRRAALRKTLLNNLKLKENIQKMENPRNPKKDDAQSEIKRRTGTKKVEDSPSSYSETETSSEDEMPITQREKPKFIKKSQRKAHNSSEPNSNQLALHLMAAPAEQLLAEKERRRAESVQLVIELSRHEQKQLEMEHAAKMADLPDDTDDPAEADKELELWKVRELQRIKKDAEMRVRFEEEQAQVLERRSMSDEKREADNRRHGSRRYEKSAASIGYLQKYYHKGVFFQDDSLVSEKMMRRDFMAPVGEDRYVDRTLLPEVMQVKNFGLSSRTKYTHLVDQDTTFGDRKGKDAMNPRYGSLDDENAAPIMGDYKNPVNPWIDFKSSRSNKFRGAAPADVFERPSKKRKKEGRRK